jgi:hypothetical protein
LIPFKFGSTHNSSLCHLHQAQVITRALIIAGFADIMPVHGNILMSVFRRQQVVPVVLFSSKLLGKFDLAGSIRSYLRGVVLTSPADKIIKMDHPFLCLPSLSYLSHLLKARARMKIWSLFNHLRISISYTVRIIRSCYSFLVVDVWNSEYC